MIISRAAEQCGQADYGWLQARYTFSFGHYFDPDLLGFASLRVLNQEVLAPGASFQPRTYPRVDILNILLQGEAEYRDSNGNHTRAKAGEALLLAAQPNISYSEHNIGNDTPLTRLQLWLDACPTRENQCLQRLVLKDQPYQLLASPDESANAFHLRQQVWVHHLNLAAGEQHTLTLNGNRAYLQSIHGTISINGNSAAIPNLLRCGDGAFVQQESSLIIRAETATRVLLVDLVV
ncbi:pirin family protein [Dickeya undicola]|uniref:Pirin family protein n=1 Tax=Dickeya undicola TaxID=1577887 RepID=A0A3N0G0T6_9GAMM|nr:pirin family protein [Dickeya undicola]RNM05778.1 pirin family protein [Dickeya undicola]RNM19687.1 pirin family protein [Dickeya undicola]